MVTPNVSPIKRRIYLRPIPTPKGVIAVVVQYPKAI